MSIVLTNWKAAVSQWLCAWLWEIVFILALGLLMMVVGAPPWVLIFLWTYPFGRMAYASMRAPKDAAGKPFSFCLPGYRESLRRPSFLAALYEGLGFAPLGLVFSWLLPSRHEGPTAMGICLYVINGFLVGAAFLLCIGIDLRFIFSRLTLGFVQLLSIPLFFVAVIVSPVFIGFAALGIPVAITVCVFVWVRLGDMSGVKRGHRMILEDALERRAQMGIKKTVSPWVEKLFRWLIADRRRLGAARYVWGSLYRTFGLAFSYWMWISVSVVVSALVLGYAAEWFGKGAFMALGLVALRVHLPVTFDGVRLPVAPREKYYATLAVAIATSLLLVGVAGVVTACTWIFSLCLLGLAGLAYAGVDPASIVLACLLVPWLLGWRLLGYRLPRIADLITWAAVVSAIAAIWLLAVARINWPGPVLPAVVMIAGWPAFLLALRDARLGAPLV